MPQFDESEVKYIELLLAEASILMSTIEIDHEPHMAIEER
jgi:hypothetical protein